MRVLVIFGGASPEHEVSIRSAKTIINGLKSNHEVYACYITKSDEWLLVEDTDSLDSGESLEYAGSNIWKSNSKELAIDVVFPIVHGVGGEDGQLQAKLDNWGVKYVGTPAKASELCFDKIATKQALRENGVDVVEEHILKIGDDQPDFNLLEKSLDGSVFFVKPSRSGSSVGVHKVNKQQELSVAIEDAFKYDTEILIERAVSEPRELEMAVLETEPNVYEASAPGEIVAEGEFYTYDSKYSATSKSETIVNPDNLPAEISKQMQLTALKANSILGCRGMVRVDFLYDGVRKKLYLNEVNTLPGFTSISMYPMLWAGSGVELESLLDILVRVASRSNG